MSPLLIVLPMFFVMGITESMEMERIHLMTGFDIDIGKRSSNSPGDCHYKGVHFQNGTVTSLPGHPYCFKYKCENGVFKMYHLACPFNGTCSDLGDRMDYMCSSYKCQKIKDKGDVVVGFMVTKPGCEDYKGKCHKPNSRFIGKHRGIIYQNCTCYVKNHKMEYDCDIQGDSLFSHTSWLQGK